MAAESFGVDAALFARLRVLWAEHDPMPAELIDQMVAAVASSDLSREYAMLTLVEGSRAAVRSDTDTATLQFSDGVTSVLVHVSTTENGGRRVDGWVDGAVKTILLVQKDRQWEADPGEQGRFAFGEVPAGLCHLRLVVESDHTHDYRTPQFEV
ncbi:hypothetical protein [Microbacterium marmarense]|uniref:Carboxypeptidase regulatory-like domain-containing protein n=1 Tax=Microbacterium marmarense TaxID=3122051 RepID=A0ABU8LW89_9MICO